VIQRFENCGGNLKGFRVDGLFDSKIKQLIIYPRLVSLIFLSTLRFDGTMGIFNNAYSLFDGFIFSHSSRFIRKKEGPHFETNKRGTTFYLQQRKEGPTMI
jgi:hypothetical protein